MTAQTAKARSALVSAPNPTPKKKKPPQPVLQLDVSPDVSAGQDMDREDLALSKLQSLPATLLELRLTACGLDTWPRVSHLQRLKAVYASANSFSAMTPLLALRQLQHVSLSHNPLRALPAPTEMRALGQLISLDISYCELHDLEATRGSLNALPGLQSVCISGNPFCLLPGYAANARCGWARALTIDGQRVEASEATSSRPSTATEAAAHPAPDTPQAEVDIFLSGLQILEDPYKPASADSTAAPGSAPAPPPQYVYHYEFSGHDGHSQLQTDVRLGRAFQGLSTAEIQKLLRELERGAASSSEQPGDVDTSENQLTHPTTEDPTGDEETSSSRPVSRGDEEGVAPEAGTDSLSTTQRPTLQLIPAVRTIDPATAMSRLSEALDGAATTYCSVPYRLQPPMPATPQSVGAQDTVGAKGAKKPPATPPGKTKPGSKPATPAQDTPQTSDLKAGWRGSLRVALPMPANVTVRDYLYRGVPMRLYRTSIHAVPKAPTPVPAQSVPSTPPTGAQGKGAKTPAPAAKDRAQSPETTSAAGTLGQEAFEYRTETELIGEGHLSTAALVTGLSSGHGTQVQFRPVKALWDDKGLRMPLEDERHSRQVVAKVVATLTLQDRPSTASSM